MDNVSKGDAVTYKFDFGPWTDDNHPLTSVTWVLQTGNASITEQTLTGSVASALVSFPVYGRNTISIAAATAHEQKQIWLYTVAHDEQADVQTDGYSFGVFF